MFDGPLNHAEIVYWLQETSPLALSRLWRRADQTRLTHIGPAVHLRGLVEISNHCARQCAYCGLHAGNTAISRYRMTYAEVMDCAHRAVRMGYGTLVLQGGEDYGITGEWMADLIRQIKTETDLAVTLSLGERSQEDLALWREAGADRYLLRIETSDRELYDLIHPPLGNRRSDRIEILRQLQSLGYEAGSGIMVGIPGQTYESIANDLLLFRKLDLDMIGIGPYIAHPDTPLGRGERLRVIPAAEQVPNDELMVYKTVALTRLLCPNANLPATTALATINQKDGRELGLSRGANIVMPNLTPVKYRELYQIYPGKACIGETAEQCNGCLRGRIARIGRTVGAGPGSRRRAI